MVVGLKEEDLLPLLRMAEAVVLLETDACLHFLFPLFLYLCLHFLFLFLFLPTSPIRRSFG